MEERGLSASLAQLATGVTDFVAERRGVPMILGFVLVLLNFILQFFPELGWLAEYHVLLHLGVLLAIGGSLLAATL